MRYTLRLFGFPVIVIEVDQFEYVDEQGSPHIEGGAAHNFERDFEPLSPTAHHEWEWEDKQRGFGFL